MLFRAPLRSALAKAVRGDNAMKALFFRMYSDYLTICTNLSMLLVWVLLPPGISECQRHENLSKGTRVLFDFF